MTMEEDFICLTALNVNYHLIELIMDAPAKSSAQHIPSLSDLLTPIQESKLAFELAIIMKHGRGAVEIEVIEGRVRYITPKPRISLDNLLTE